MLILLAMFATMISCDKPAYSYPDMVPFDLHATSDIYDNGMDYLCGVDVEDDNNGSAYGDACETAEKAGAT